MTASRFDFDPNLRRAGSYVGQRGELWAPSGSYEMSFLDLSEAAPEMGNEGVRALGVLRCAIDSEWQRVKEIGSPARSRFNDPQPIVGALRQVGECLPGDVDREAVRLRADAVEHGYAGHILEALAFLEEDVTVVAGQIATWYGKQLGGLPTAFGCHRDELRQRSVTERARGADDLNAFLADLHADLRLGDLPSFSATQLFFMAGEGNLHPKHIAYFLPEDEGVKHTRYRKTFYFANTHADILADQSGPLAAQFLDVGVEFEPVGGRFADLATLGVLGHEFGHSVRRPATSFEAIHGVNRWASAVLQEVAADVFGTLILAEVWADRVGRSPADAVVYYLAECLRYVNRGLGRFPDSDGMFLQLSYFVQLGALAVKEGREPRLVGDPAAVIAALRSLARVLADAFLAGKAERAIALYYAFGPSFGYPLGPIVDEMGRLPVKSVEYQQDHIPAPVGSAT